ncbi:MAG: hypothetical protein JXX14_16130, partial [Deltaproteobacteria bacterium]|nr:hypothetical protein [Deltaproteobacteria bacterium]
ESSDCFADSVECWFCFLRGTGRFSASAGNAMNNVTIMQIAALNINPILTQSASDVKIRLIRRHSEQGCYSLTINMTLSM